MRNESQKIEVAMFEESNNIFQVVCSKNCMNLLTFSYVSSTDAETKLFQYLKLHMEFLQFKGGAFLLEIYFA